MSSAPPRRPVTIEDLLRLKRAERPPAEFWTEWDRQLRTKQLAAAILDKRPWWRDALPRLGLALGRYHLPLGATAILALSILTVREYRSVNTALPVPAATPVARVGAPSAKLDESDTGSLAELRQPANAARDEVATVFAQPQKISHSVSLLPTTSNSAMDAMSRPAAREMAANLAVARATDPGLARILRSVAGYELSAPRVQVEEPLARVAALHDTRQGRLQVYAANATYAPDSNSTVSRFHDRQVSRLNEEQLYEATVHRIGATGDRAWLKF
jgi:hypothetical protein